MKNKKISYVLKMHSYIKKKRLFRSYALILCITLLCSFFQNDELVSAKAKRQQQNIVKVESDNDIDTTEYTLEDMSDVVKNVVYSSEKEPYCIVNDDIDVDNSVTVKNTDGSLTTHIFPYNIKENDGKRVRFVGKKIKTQKRDGYDYVDDSGNIVRRFSKDIDNGIKLENNNTSVELSPMGIVKKSEFQTKNRDYKLSKSIKGITYKDAFSENIDVEYIAEANGIKENIILDKYEGIHEFCFKINTNGLVPDTLFSNEGSIQLINPQNNKCEMVINPVYAFDSYSEENEDERHVTINNSMRLEQINNIEYKLIIDIDEEFLTSSSTVYPVTIDPAITIPSNQMENTMVFRDNPNERISWSTIMFVGRHNVEDYGMTEMYVRLKDISEYKYISPKNINSVTFNIYEWSGHTFPARIELYDLFSKNWQKDEINWNNRPSTCGVAQSYVDYPPSERWSNFDITNLFKKWLSYELKEGSGFSKDYGFCLKATPDNEHSRYYYSVNDSQRPPTITINYREDMSVSNDIYYLRNCEELVRYDGDNNEYHVPKYLDAHIDEEEAIVYPFKGQSNQEWKIEMDPKTGLYKLYNMYYYGFENLALDTATTKDGSKVDFWNADSTGSWIKYRLVKNSDNSYRIMPQYGEKNRALTFVNNDEDYISKCVFTEYKGLKSQKWILEKAPNFNMKQRTIDVNVVLDTTFRKAYGSKYMEKIKSEFSISNVPFQHVFNIDFNEKYINDYDHFKNKYCPVSDYAEACDPILCGTDCSKHHRGWEQGKNALIKYYTASDNPRGFAVGIVGTGLCYADDVYCEPTGGLTDPGGQYAIIPKPSASNWDNLGSIRRQQHEFTHFFGIDDGGNPCTVNQRCIMSGGFEHSVFSDIHNIWCENCMRNIHDFIEIYWK